MPIPVYPIQTARLLLRPFTPADLDDLFAYMSREDVVRYLYGGVKDRAESETLIQKWMATPTLEKDGDQLNLAVVLAADGRQPGIGEVTIKLTSLEHRQASIGWVFNPDYHGHGYATEAAAAMLALGFTQFVLHRIFASCDARNTASYKVMQRLGLRREAHFIHNEIFKGEWGEELVYAILQGEWANRAANGDYPTSQSASILP